MIVPDLNLLLYSSISGFSQHERARAWWEETLSGNTEVGLVSPVILGYIRLTTGARLLDHPLTAGQAVLDVRSWLDQPYVRLLPDTEATLNLTMDLLATLGAAGNLTTDAQIAAHALGIGATVATNDSDFARFTGLPTLNPLVD